MRDVPSWGALDELASRHTLAASLSLRAIGLTSFAAFVSLHVQVSGLFGTHGIDPMTGRVEEMLRYVEHPMATAPSLLYWVGGSDAAMSALCFVGEIASLAMVAQALGAIAPLVAWACYLSFVSLGAPFLPLQWDTLLTESLFVAAIASPLALRPVKLRDARAPHPLALFALWLLVGRLMFASGWVKLASGDDAWWSLTALDYHFETQPLPAIPGYWLHFGPSFVRTLGVVLTFVVELVLPVAIFFGRLGRRIAAAGFLGLMSMIATTGNYGFFDLLACALTLALVDDEAIVRLARGRLTPSPERDVRELRHVVAPFAVAQMFLGLVALLSTLGARPSLPGFVTSLDTTADPFRIANGYGLFAVMTRDRPIVIFEGSEDGETWHEYDYRWQSGDPARAPAFCAPHMPRVDWMVWFAGLGDGPEGWIVATQVALLEARPDVLALFGRDPFDGRRPMYVRTVRYEYEFAAPGEDDWWVRSDRAEYGPTLQRR